MRKRKNMKKTKNTIRSKDINKKWDIFGKWKPFHTLFQEKGCSLKLDRNCDVSFVHFLILGSVKVPHVNLLILVKSSVITVMSRLSYFVRLVDISFWIRNVYECYVRSHLTLPINSQNIEKNTLLAMIKHAFNDVIMFGTINWTISKISHYRRFVSQTKSKLG